MFQEKYVIVKKTRFKTNKKMDIKVFKENEKLDEAYGILADAINKISKDYQLNYYELFGLLECFHCDLIKQNIEDFE